MSNKYIIDEICFSSDKNRYIFDSKDEKTGNRLSIFKDGKGFLNFRIIENDENSKEITIIVNRGESIIALSIDELKSYKNNV